MKKYILSYGFWGPFVSFLLMILQTLIAPLPSFLITLANAMIFGPFYGFLLSIFSALFASYVAFYISNWFGRPFFSTLKSSNKIDGFVACHGGKGIFILRLFPIISFDLISYLAGLTSISAWKFGVATLFGMIPATLAFSILGSSFESANQWLTGVGAFILLLLVVFGFLGKRKFF
ncbi:MAG: TVP38/TMEM64 family protein [Nitrospinota bacterium]|nr:TVP38/TMEM64 family protein [Nitrospinota bacterium]